MRTLKLISFANLRVLLCIPYFIIFFDAEAQVCSDPENVIYGLTNTGTIHAIDVNTGIADADLNPAYTGNAPDQSNGLGYNPVNGKFYYFKRIPSSTIIEFVSFDPATNTYEALSSPATTDDVFSGSIPADGLGYYCWDTQGRLFYYRISNNTWTTITSNIVDQFGKDVDSIIRANTSGDGAIDGYGNLWFLPSGNSSYGLFRTTGPLPTTAIATLTVEEVVAMTPPPSRFVGISFTLSGQIFMIASNNGIYRLEDNLSLTLMSTVPFSMGDLTSCNFPMAVLAGGDHHFVASMLDGKVKLTWKPSQQQGSFLYILERSSDNRNWNTIAKGSDLSFSVNKISYIDADPLNGRNFYRIKIIGTGNHITYSVVRTVEFNKANKISVWPNPVTSELFIRNGNENAVVTVFNQAGSKIRAFRIGNGINNINVKNLPSGKYFMVVRTTEGVSSTYKLIKK